MPAQCGVRGNKAADQLAKIIASESSPHNKLTYTSYREKRITIKSACKPATGRTTTTATKDELMSSFLPYSWSQLPELPHAERLDCPPQQIGKQTVEHVLQLWPHTSRPLNSCLTCGHPAHKAAWLLGVTLEKGPVLLDQQLAGMVICKQQEEDLLFWADKYSHRISESESDNKVFFNPG